MVNSRDLVQNNRYASKLVKKNLLNNGWKQHFTFSWVLYWTFARNIKMCVPLYVCKTCRTSNVAPSSRTKAQNPDGDKLFYTLRFMTFIWFGIWLIWNFRDVSKHMQLQSYLDPLIYFTCIKSHYFCWRPAKIALNQYQSFKAHTVKEYEDNKQLLPTGWVAITWSSQFYERINHNGAHNMCPAERLITTLHIVCVQKA